MRLKGVLIENTFAEAFPMWVSRLIITADTPRLAHQAAEAATGLAFSIIGCGCEAGIEGDFLPSETSDGRPGVAALFFSYAPDKLEEHLLLRIGQAILPSATSACFNGLVAPRMAKVGGKLRYFANGFQSSKLIGDQRYWRIPVADGEFVLSESFGIGEGVGGGNLIILGTEREKVLEAAEAAGVAIWKVRGAIAPFPGGVCRSPSKPGSKYKEVRASTNDAYAPTLRTRVTTELKSDEQCAYEIVIDGITEQVVRTAMQEGIRAACLPGVTRITAGNYGGKWGPYHLYLHKLLKDGKA
jgi:formylmethanofuran--tetrahydromethanopterin N-formyltransferase